MVLGCQRCPQHNQLRIIYCCPFRSGVDSPCTRPSDARGSRGRGGSAPLRWPLRSNGARQRGGSVMAYDLLIKNGRVVDGSGEPSFQADVAVHQGKIVGVGKSNATATRIINAEGRVVAP